MKHLYFRRDIEPKLRNAVTQFPVLLVTGPRQAGKSTLLRHVLKGFRYVTLDDPARRALAIADPRLFLATHAPPVVIDEIQYAPGLLPFIKMDVDEHRRAHGRFALTGSQTFALMEGVSESLAGRVAILELPPFSWSEIAEIRRRRRFNLRNDHDVLERIVTGFYPESLVHPKLDRDTWFASYINTYLERDVRNLRRVTDLSRFQTFLSLLATRAGGLLNMAEVGKECGITQPTAKDWISILESTYVVHLLKPWHTNIVKRVVKSPKLYFLDTGLLCHLLGIDSAARLAKASERGHIFENMVIMDRYKRTLAGGRRPRIFFYRSGAGVEVDLIELKGTDLHASEIKFTKTVTREMASGLLSLAKDKAFRGGELLSLQEAKIPITDKIVARHWASSI